jgi:hypothetical protein
LTKLRLYFHSKADGLAGALLVIAQKMWKPQTAAACGWPAWASWGAMKIQKPVY